MSDEINTQDQVNKFFDAYNILTDIWLEQPHISKLVDLIRPCAICVGIIMGKLHERYMHQFRLTRGDIQNIPHEIQSNFLISGDEEDRRVLRTFLAHTSEHLEQAFDIALHDKPLPEPPDGYDKGHPRSA